MDYSYVTYFDASVAVKLVVNEPGSDNARQHFHARRGPVFMTSLCFAETLGVLKRKKLCREQYLGACHQLIAYLTGAPLRLHLDDAINIRMETFIQAEALAQKHNLDLSDALQIITIKDGRFKKRADTSTTLLTTADAGLAKAAEHEGLRVWNVLETAEPPDC